MTHRSDTRRHSSLASTLHAKGIAMKSRIHRIIVAGLVMTAFTFAQQNQILPSQISAIKSLAINQGFTPTDLDNYVLQMQGVPLADLTRQQGAALIQSFQSASPPRPLPPPQPVAARRPSRPAAPKASPPPPAEPREPIIATILEVGMSKRFHLIDGNIVEGTIVSLEGVFCNIETIDGLLRVPRQAILEETARITKRNDTRYVGPVLKETLEEIVLRSGYGDVVISKKDIKEMDRYHGGERMTQEEVKQTFYGGEAVLTDIFSDPTAFPLAANTLYISGLSFGYAFTDRFMIRSSFGDDFKGDMNLHPILQFYHRGTGTSEVAAAIGFHMFNNHPISASLAKYSEYVQVLDSLGNPTGNSVNDDGISAKSVLVGKTSHFFWRLYMVLSSRRSLASGRGKMGWHLGIQTNSLILDRPKIDENFYNWDTDLPWITKDGIIPFRAWVAFEYDLSKRLKLEMNVWADNGHRYRSIASVMDDYWLDGTLLVLDQVGGDFRPVDFDFGLLYAFGETLRVGIHFQEPYFLLYWEFYQL